MMMKPPAIVTLCVDRLGRGTIVVNGVNISRLVRAVRVESRTGDLTCVALEIAATDLTAEIEAALSIDLVTDDQAAGASPAGVGGG